MYKYVVFDVDGTLIDTEKAVIFAYQTLIFKKYGRYFTNEELLKGYGVPTPVTLEKYGFTNIDEAVEEYYEYLFEGFKKCTAFDGIFAVVNTLKENKIPLAIVTSRCSREVENDSCLQSFIHLFDAVVTSDDTVLHKPHPDPLLKAIEKISAAPSETIYIGDTVFDRACARDAGVKFALALWGSNNAESIDADYFFKKPSDLLDVI